jgi:hypothetical protein
MLVKTILNRVQKFKCFVYKNARLIDSGKAPKIEVDIQERANRNTNTPIQNLPNTTHYGSIKETDIKER